MSSCSSIILFRFHFENNDFFRFTLTISLRVPGKLLGQQNFQALIGHPSRFVGSQIISEGDMLPISQVVLGADIQMICHGFQRLRPVKGFSTGDSQIAFMPITYLLQPAAHVGKYLSAGQNHVDIQNGLGGESFHRSAADVFDGQNGQTL